VSSTSRSSRFLYFLSISGCVGPAGKTGQTGKLEDFYKVMKSSISQLQTMNSKSLVFCSILVGMHSISWNVGYRIWWLLIVCEDDNSTYQSSFLSNSLSGLSGLAGVPGPEGQYNYVTCISTIKYLPLCS